MWWSLLGEFNNFLLKSNRTGALWATIVSYISLPTNFWASALKTSQHSSWVNHSNLKSCYVVTLCFLFSHRLKVKVLTRGWKDFSPFLPLCSLLTLFHPLKLPGHFSTTWACPLLGREGCLCICIQVRMLFCVSAQLSSSYPLRLCSNITLLNFPYNTL